MEVRITLHTGNGDYEVSLEGSETNGEAWGADKSHLDAMVDEAVRRLKRSYTPVSETR